jgi:hypothetical protein
MGYEQYMLTRNVETVELDLPYKEDEERLSVDIRPLAWAKKNALVSQCTSYGSDGNVNFNGQMYINEVLKYVITKAPWGKTDDVFLSKIGLELGTALEQLVPSATNNDVVEQSENLA